MSAPSAPSSRWKPRFHPLTPVLLAVVWVLLWGVLTPAAAVGGLLLGLAVVIIFPLPKLSLGVRLRLWPLIVLVAVFLVDLVKASIHVALTASAPWIHPQGRIITVPLRTDHDLFGVLTAELTTLVPGSIVIDIDTAAREMTVHVYDNAAGDDDGFRRQVAAQEARVLRALAADADEILAADQGASR